MAIVHRRIISLVFMGSRKYPYKGIIDRLANRGFANGTNAWTESDHTCYTVDTAGSQGFLQILPIYVDHILFPTLTQSAYTTEVCIYVWKSKAMFNIIPRFIMLMEKAMILVLSTAKCKEDRIHLGT